MRRRRFLRNTAAAALGPVLSAPLQGGPRPNIVLIVADDLGYGDLSCYGSHISTPNLDRMAREGVVFTQFYAPNPVCSPSRAGILTGRYGVRGGVPVVLSPTDAGGLAKTETTIAQMLKPLGYRTMCVGKWHLGRTAGYLPTSRGFDEYFGIPYSNDQQPSVLMHNADVVESPVNLSTLTRRYTEVAVSFIRSAQDSPFFLYVPHTFPHVPLAASPAFNGKSGMGLYGDVVQELDWSVGQVLNALVERGLDQNTLVFFTSDNGPWFQGSPGRLRGRKGETFEGGMRAPFIARFPGRIPPGPSRRGVRNIRVVDAMASGLDLLPAIAGFTGASLPSNPLDGVDIGPVLTGQADEVKRPPFLYFSGWNLQCARMGAWKLHLSRANAPAFTTEPKVGWFNLPLMNPELYNIDNDPEEAEDAALHYPDTVTLIQNEVTRMLPSFPPEVQAAWQETRSRKVYPHQPGEWPAPVLN